MWGDVSTAFGNLWGKPERQRCLSSSSPLIGAFIIQKVTASLVTDWKSHAIGDFRIFLHPSTRLSRWHDQGRELVIIGDAFCHSSRRSMEDVVGAALETGKIDPLRTLCGRFVIVYREADALKIFQDPAGSRTVYYSPEKATAASHAVLVQIATGASLDRKSLRLRESPDYSKRKTQYLPGHLTLFSGVRQMAPNHILDLTNNSMSRIRDSLKPVNASFDLLLSSLESYFQSFGDHLNRTGTSPLVGLTGGGDARLMLAGLRSFGLTPRTVTWPGIDQHERRIISTMVESANLEHRFLSEEHPSDSTSVMIDRDELRASGFIRQANSPTGRAAQMASVSAPREVFIFGLGAEIVRGFWAARYYRRHEGGLLPPASKAQLIDHYFSKKLTAPKEDFDRGTRQAFEKYFHDFDWNAVENTEWARDLWYWEHRMGTWGANRLNVMDLAIPSYFGFNSLEIFKLGMSLPPEVRFDKSTWRNLITYFDKALGSVSII